MCLPEKEVFRYFEEGSNYWLSLVERRVRLVENGIYDKDTWAYGAIYMEEVAKGRTFDEFCAVWKKWLAIRRLAGKPTSFLGARPRTGESKIYPRHVGRRWSL